METEKIRIVNVLTDIRSGKDQAQLAVKYGLSAHAIEALFRQMIPKGDKCGVDGAR